MSTIAFYEGEVGASGEPTENLERLQDAMKGTAMTREQVLSNFVKRHGIAAVARSINKSGVFLTEEEYSKLLSEDCKRTGRNFTAAIEGGRASDPDTIEIAKAWRRCSDAGFASRQATFSKAAGSSAHYLAGDADYYGVTERPGRASLKPRLSTGRESVNSPKSALDAVPGIWWRLRCGLLQIFQKLKRGTGCTRIPTRKCAGPSRRNDLRTGLSPDCNHESVGDVPRYVGDGHGCRTAPTGFLGAAASTSPAPLVAGLLLP
jgi:hypothetical protein